MMNQLKEYYKLFPALWEGYQVGNHLGSGSFGDVYQLLNRDGQAVEALKEIVVPPPSMGGFEEAILQGLDREGAAFFYDGMKKKAMDEVKLLKQFSRCPNIVQIKDAVIKELPEGDKEYGWVIFVRMELLEPFKTKLLNEGISLNELAQLGCDLCNALEACHEQGVLHRDIKPENVFYSPADKIFKLGDFGISCYAGRLTEEKGLPGTLTHMAPEVYHGKPFDYEADLYAVGIILYKLLNENRIPFLPDYPEKYSPAMRNQAMGRRLNGEEIPLPSILRKKDMEGLLLHRGTLSEHQINRLANIVTRAIHPDPKERYGTPNELRKELVEFIL